MNLDRFTGCLLGVALGDALGTAAWPADLVERLALREHMEQLAAELWRAAQP